VDVSALLTGAPGTAPIVVASAMAYAPEWWYGSPGLRARLHYLADLPYAVQQPDFLPEFSLVTNQWCVPSKVDDYRQFVSTHDHFLLYSVGAPQLEWVAARLQSEGWWLTVLRTDEHATLYVVDGMRPPGL
jgi:hypothetical protein